jgi:hypothetical protein
MGDETSRKQFEEFENQFHYTGDSSAFAWAAWKASRDAALSEAAELCKKSFIETGPLGEMVYCCDLQADILALRGGEGEG